MIFLSLLKAQDKGKAEKKSEKEEERKYSFEQNESRKNNDG